MWRGLHAGLADRTGAAGDVDENVNAAAEGIFGDFDRGLALPGICEIAGDHDRLAPAGLHLVCDRRYRLGVAFNYRLLAAFGSAYMVNVCAHAFIAYAL